MYGCPRVINIEPELVEAGESPRDKKDKNPFQTIFKNKMKLKSRYGGESGGADEKGFGEEEGFRIRQAVPNKREQPLRRKR